MTTKTSEKDKQRATKWRRENRDRANQISSKSYFKRKAEGVSNPGARTQTKVRKEEPEKALLRCVKQRAKRKGLPFDLELSDINIPNICPIRKVPFVFEPFRHDDGPSIDRIIPELGYIRGNVQIISMRANRMKSNGTLEDAKRLVEYLELNTRKGIFE